MEAKYTKGPWDHDGHDGRMYPMVVDNGCGLCIAEVFGGCEDCPSKTVAVANANLIAAAPELLKELQGQMTAMDFLLEAMDIDPEETFIEIKADGDSVAKVTFAELAARAQAVCAKALGEAR